MFVQSLLLEGFEYLNQFVFSTVMIMYGYEKALLGLEN